jgi:hypothetical protein
MREELVEPFAAYRKLGRGAPTLRAWKHPKTIDCRVVRAV